MSGLFDVKVRRQEIIGFYHEYEEYGCFSNWYMSSFEYAGITFNCVEQYMMYQKMVMFKAYKIAQDILDSDDPGEIKKLGRTKISNFDSDLWDKLSYTIVKRAIKAKFLQNKQLQDILLSTGNKILAECAPNDRKWGIGVANTSNDYKNVEKWNGKNFLGRALMEVREEIRNGHTDYVDYFEADPNEIWEMVPGELRNNPKYYNAIQAYALTLPYGHVRDCFLYQTSFHGWEISMNTNMGGGLPIQGFFEMKQELYELFNLYK